MGLSLPLYGYLVARGAGSVRVSVESKMNAKNAHLITQAAALLELRQKEICGSTVWFHKSGSEVSREILHHKIYFEKNECDRGELITLIEEMGGMGTIIVPNQQHIKPNRESFRAFSALCSQSIAVVYATSLINILRSTNEESAIDKMIKISNGARRNVATIENSLKSYRM